MKNRKILIALDYHPSAQIIAEKGWELSIAFNAKVLLLHIIADQSIYDARVYDPIMGFNGFLNMIVFENQEDITANLEQTAYEYLFKAKEHLGGLSIETLVNSGDSSECIIQVATEQCVDLIVMGNHTQKKVEHFFTKSVLQTVLETSIIPLYIIPIE